MKIKILLFLAGLPLLLAGCIGLSSNSDPDGLQADQKRDVIIADTARTYLSNNIKIGMSEPEVLRLIGDPNEDNVTRTAAGKSEQWVYSGQQVILNHYGRDAWAQYSSDLNILINDFHIYLNFDNGILTSTQGF